jgi:hypothetical protein
MQLMMILLYSTSEKKRLRQLSMESIYIRSLLAEQVGIEKYSLA